MGKISLYQITEEFKALDELLEQEGGEISDASEELESSIAQLLTSKVDACVEYRIQEKDLIELAKQRIKQLQDFVKTKENKVKRYDEYIITCLERLDTKKVEGQLHSISIRKPSVSVNILDQDKIPAEYVTVETVIKIDKNKIRKALEDAPVEGATLVSEKKSLTVR